jgi:hypothetical protein
MGIGIKEKTIKHEGVLTPKSIIQIQESTMSSIGTLMSVRFPIHDIMKYKYNFELFECTLWSLLVCSVKISLDDFENDEERNRIYIMYDDYINQSKCFMNGFLQDFEQLKNTKHEYEENE